MATSPIYGWAEPDNTDLVKNGALAIRTLGNAIDTTMATMTPKSTFTAKGSIAVASAASTPANLSVGGDGNVLVADSSTATGLRYQATNAAGKNAIINGGMDIWQRGTTFAITSAASTYTADRWYGTTLSGTATYSQESSVVPVNQKYALKMLATATTQPVAGTVIETLNSLPFAGSTVVVTGQVAASTSTVMDITVQYSTTVDESPTGASWVTIAATSGGAANPTSTTYVPITGTYAIPSTAKTLKVFYKPTSTIANTVALYGTRFQLEVGSVGTTFTRSGGDIQGELAACQRYYWRNVSGEIYALMSGATPAGSTTEVDHTVIFPVTMRVRPTSVDYSTLATYDGTTTYLAGTYAIVNGRSGTYFATVRYTHGTATLTQYRPYQIIANNNTTAYLGLNAEL